MTDASKPEEAEVPRRPAVRGSSQSELRAHNERLILSILRNHGPTAKAEIARMTGLSAQSASVIMRKLEGEALIERCAPVRGKVGQPSIPMRLAIDGALFFGLKVGRRSTDMILVDFLGTILDRVHLTYRYPEPDQTLGFVHDSIAQITKKLTAQQQGRIAGLGIAIPGYLWEWAKIIDEPSDKMDTWKERDIRAEIDDLYDFPVYLQNDATCACGAELVFGGQDYPAEFLYFYVGYFIGGGLVINHALFTGPTGNAGALGPLPAGGSQGAQLIDVASLSGLEKSMLDAGADAAALWESSASWNVDRDLLSRWLDQAAEGLAHATVVSCSVIDFELVVIDGWLPEEVRRELVDLTAQKMRKLNWAGLIQPDVREGSIGPDARSLGAASLPLSQRFMVSKRVF